MSVKCKRKERNSEDLFVKDLLGEGVFAQTSGILSVAWFLSLGSPKIPWASRSTWQPSWYSSYIL